MVKISREHEIVKIKKKTIAKVLFSSKRPGERYLAAQFVEAGHAKWQPKFDLRRVFYSTYFPVWENCILESIEEPLAMKTTAMKTTITMT